MPTEICVFAKKFNSAAFLRQGVNKNTFNAETAEAAEKKMPRILCVLCDLCVQTSLPRKTRHVIESARFTVVSGRSRLSG